MKLRIICVNPPPDEYEGKSTIFGLQNKSGEVVEGEAHADETRHYECVVTVNARGSLSGDFVHGTPESRFLYLSWGYQPGEWIKRIKIPLADVTLEMLESGRVAEARVDGAGAATVKLLGSGWMLVDS